jgi:hypothetical protein
MNIQVIGRRGTFKAYPLLSGKKRKTRDIPVPCQSRIIYHLVHPVLAIEGRLLAPDAKKKSHQEYQDQQAPR